LLLLKWAFDVVAADVGRSDFAKADVASVHSGLMVVV